MSESKELREALAEIADHQATYDKVPGLDRPTEFALARYYWGVIGWMRNRARAALSQPPAGQEPCNSAGETPTQHAHRWATELATSMARKFYPESPQWKPLPDLLGVITQIDNMTTGLTRAAPAGQGAEPVAWMWQHDETGRIGFVDQWQIQNGWAANNPRNKLIAPLYRRPQLASDWRLCAADFLRARAAEREPLGWANRVNELVGAAELLEELASASPFGLDCADPSIYAAPPAEQAGAGEVPSGWKLVPIEPTQEMCQKGQWKAQEWPKFPLRISPIYQAMVAAAPHPPQPESGSKR